LQQEQKQQQPASTARPLLLPAALPAGKGAFGTVRLVLEKKSGKLYACKSISKGKLISKEDVEDIRREVGAGGSCWCGDGCWSCVEIV
jgi:NAD(P)H-nitrite reductase large subunit